MTRFELIKSLTLEQMVEFLYEHCDCSCCSRSHFDSCRDPGIKCRDHIREYLESEDDINGLLSL